MAKIKEMIGRRFGQWTVLKKSERQAADGTYYWICRCDCGTEKEVRGQNLRNGLSLRCESYCPLFVYNNKCKIFDKKVVELKNGCWIWTGLRNQDGYGQIGNGILVHRFSYERFKGVIPNELCVLHTCNVPSCCNPSHLFLGTRCDNNKDTVKKGRSALNEKCGRAKLTKDVVIKIRNLHKEGQHTKADLAKMFDVKHCTISQIINRETWKNI